MTTEIAVLNRLGIALATDSAVTITAGGRTKVFDTADKLFELSPIFPVAAMINGNMDCLGVPWELLIKDFRDRMGSAPRVTVSDWMDDLISFVQSHSLLSDAVHQKHIRDIVNDEISTIQHSVGKKFEALFLGTKNGRKGSGQNIDLKEQFKTWIMEEASKEINYFEDIGVSDSLKSVDFCR